MFVWELLVEQAFASGEAWMPGPIQVSNLKVHLPQEPSFAGPLMGGGSTKELNKWINERIDKSPYDAPRLLLGVLKVACQHYGKLRSSNVNSGNPAMVGFGAANWPTLLFDLLLSASRFLPTFASFLCRAMYASCLSPLRCQSSAVVARFSSSPSCFSPSQDGRRGLFRRSRCRGCI